PVRPGDDRSLLRDRAVRRCDRLELDHTARGVAVERGRRAAYDLGPGKEAQVHMAETRLTVREGGWQAIDQHLHPAHAELRAGAEAADRDALAEREVVPI